MAKQIVKLICSSAVAVCLLCMSIQSAIADVLNIKSDAPQTYVVQKGDTLWDISNLFLDKPWLWPELWRNNTQIENPHLIYPGDVLKLRYENGQPVLEVVREKSNLILTPDVKINSKPVPIDILPWSRLAPFIKDGQLMDIEEYHQLPNLLGDRADSPLFASKDFVLTRDIDASQSDYKVVRKLREVKDSAGQSLGLQVESISEASLVADAQNGRHLVKLEGSYSEARKGDKLAPDYKKKFKDLVITPAKEHQRGELVENVTGRTLIGKQDIVIINLGGRKVSPGTVFGIYEKGADIKFKEEQTYSLERASLYSLFSMSETIEQPAYKVGELIVFNTFEHGSYAYVTKVETHLKGGEIIAAP
ncbi:LysM peptidoglycan-binding domain-containing protein [Glaciecola sp. 1036]|uniref:LysM peptidoglycan-binding domain-containing protein n=1 Tax=Alteromonadaceae TaxID=72275 RepID=UPI003D062E9A